MYGERSASSAPMATDLASIEVAPIPNRQGQLLRNELTSLLDPAATAAADKRYTLRVNLKETVNTFAIERSGFATTANVEIIATYTLVDDASGNALVGGSSRAFNDYNILENDYSTYVAGGDARNRAITQVAYEIRNRLAAHFAESPAASPPAAHPGSTPTPTSTSDPSGT
jgi:LPS-assembly lipoprotein